MRISSLVFAVSVLMIPLFATPSSARNQYIEIRAPFINIYKELDPKSEVIKMGKRGDRYELIAEGEGNRWYRVKAGDRDGWVEQGAAMIVEKEYVFPVWTFVIIVLLFVVTMVMVFYYIFVKNRPSPMDEMPI